LPDESPESREGATKAERRRDTSKILQAALSEFSERACPPPAPTTSPSAAASTSG